MVMSLLGHYNNFFFAAHLLDIAMGVKTLRTILSSVTHNGKQVWRAGTCVETWERQRERGVIKRYWGNRHESYLWEQGSEGGVIFEGRGQRGIVEGRASLGGEGLPKRGEAW